MQKGIMIGKGMTAEVYALEDNKVLKLYFDWVGKELIDFEAKIGKVISEAGIPSPKFFSIVEVDGRKGIIFERANGKSMLKLIEVKPWKIVYYARQMARLHARIHSYSTEQLSSQEKELKDAINFSVSTLGNRTERILEVLKKLPSGKSICHGDFHPDNIIVSSKRLVVIDWTNAYSGNCLGDVARTCLMIRTPFVPPETPSIIVMLSKVIKRIIYSVYLKEYKRLTNVRTDDINAWMLPVAAARLREKIPGEKKWLLNIIDKYLSM